MNDIKHLIDVAKTAKDIKWTEDEKKLGDVHKFLLTFNFQTGKVGYEKLILELFYENWSKNPLKPRNFHREAKKHIKYDNGTYYINEAALNINKEEIIKVIGKTILKRASEKNQETEEEEKSFKIK